MIGRWRNRTATAFLNMYRYLLYLRQRSYSTILRRHRVVMLPQLRSTCDDWSLAQPYSHRVPEHVQMPTVFASQVM